MTKDDVLSGYRQQLFANAGRPLDAMARRDSDAHQRALGGRRLTLVWVQVGPSAKDDPMPTLLLRAVAVA